MSFQPEDLEESGDELTYKIAFAEQWLRNPHNTFEAAMQVCQGRTLEALQMSQAWMFDSEVLQLKEELVAKYGEEHFLPSKSDMLHSIYRRANQDHTANEDFVKLMKLAADMRGMLQEKTAVAINNITNNKVMMVPVFVDASGKVASDDSWEQSLIAQQQRLVAQ